MTADPALDELPEALPIDSRAAALVHLVNAATGDEPAQLVPTIEAVAILLQDANRDPAVVEQAVEQLVAAVRGTMAYAPARIVELLRVLDVDDDELAEVGIDVDEL